ncbi:TPA: hypothetical protein U2I51_000405, partial [Providencia rettgeri]|nr:hypothetical protein [Providencia rettgeri]
MRFLLFPLFIFSALAYAEIKSYDVSFKNPNYYVSDFNPETGYWSANFSGIRELETYQAKSCTTGTEFNLTSNIIQQDINLPLRNPNQTPKNVSIKFTGVKCLIDWIEVNGTNKANRVYLEYTYRAFYCPKDSVYTFNNLDTKSGCPSIEHGSLEEYCLKQPTLYNITVKNPTHDGKDYIFNNSENGCKYFAVGDVLLKQENPLRITSDWATIGVADLDTGNSEIIENDNGNEGGNG